MPISTQPGFAQPIRNVVKWQAIGTGVVATLAAVWAGISGNASDTASGAAAYVVAAALSAVLGGIVNVSAVVVYAFVVGISRPASPGATLTALFRAEAIKILVIVFELWLVLTIYKDIVLAAFFAAFVVTVLMFRMALFDRA